MKRVLCAALLALLLMSAGCAPEIQHDPRAAAAVAEKYVQTVFVDQDADAAFAMLDPDYAAEQSPEAFRQVVGMRDFGARIGRVEAMAYDKVPGEPMMDVFVTGYSDDEEWYFRVRVVGTSSEGYRPTQADAGSDPFPGAGISTQLN